MTTQTEVLFQLPSGPLPLIDFVPTASGWMTIDQRGGLRALDPTGRLLAQGSASRNALFRGPLVASFDGAEVAVGLRKIDVFDARTAKKTRSFAGHGSADVTSVYVADGWLASSGKVNVNKVGNDVRVWDWASGAQRHVIKLPSRRRKAPCQVDAVTGAAGTSTLFALGWSPRGADEQGDEPFVRYLHRLDAEKGSAEPILEFEDDHQPSALLATARAVFLARHSTEGGVERWTLQRFTHDGARTAERPLDHPSAVLLHPNGGALLVLRYDSLDALDEGSLATLSSTPLGHGVGQLAAQLFDHARRLAYVRVGESQLEAVALPWPS